jgi:hypothetical protein
MDWQRRNPTAPPPPPTPNLIGIRSHSSGDERSTFSPLLDSVRPLRATKAKNRIKFLMSSLPRPFDRLH